MDFVEICKNYGRLLAEHGVERIDGSDRSFYLNDLVFNFEKQNNRWVPVGLGFSLFGDNTVLLITGELLVIEKNEDGEEEPLTIAEQEVVTKFKEYLVWRLRTLKDLGI